jgi:DNA-binding response OmpR family regulator
MPGIAKPRFPRGSSRIAKARDLLATAAHSMAGRTAMLDGVSILLVEDDGDLRELLAMVLHGHGAAVTSAATLAEARDALRRHTHDVLVTDLGLPDGHGHVLGHEALRGGVSATIALTGDKRDETVDASRASGFRLHLAKPIDPEMLAHVVASLGF